MLRSRCVSAPTTDLAAAVDLYEKRARRPPTVTPSTRLSAAAGPPPTARPSTRLSAEFETGTVTLALLACERLGIEFQPNKVPIALQVQDVEAARAELQSRGVSFQGDIVDSGVCHQAYFQDPDGNALDLHHRYAPRT